MSHSGGRSASILSAIFISEVILSCTVAAVSEGSSTKGSWAAASGGG